MLVFREPKDGFRHFVLALFVSCRVSEAEISPRTFEHRSCTTVLNYEEAYGVQSLRFRASFLEMLFF